MVIGRSVENKLSISTMKVRSVRKELKILVNGRGMLSC